jgi:hypothetical protein
MKICQVTCDLAPSGYGSSETLEITQRGLLLVYPQSSSTLWNYSKCGVYTVESEAGC